MDAPDLPGVARRFLRYVQIDTQSDAASATTPSTPGQKVLGRLLVDELQALGVADAAIDEHGYVYAGLASTLPAEEAAATPAVAFLAHLDTSPQEPGGPVVPVVHRAYDGAVIPLPGDPTVTLDPARSPALLDHLGQDLISSDGTTLLGSDDKAGVAVIMQLVEDLLADPAHPRPPLRVCFTVDEEIARGVDKIDLARLGAEVAYTVDGGAVGTLDTATFNAAEATVRIEGVNVHPGTAKGVMANAAAVLAELIAALPAAETPETTDGDDGFFCPYRLNGDVGQAEVRILLRDFTADGLARRKRLIEQLAAAAGTKHPRASVSVSIVDQYKNMHAYIEERDPRAIVLAHAAGEAMGLPLSEEPVRGGTDGSRLSEMGLPTPNVFTGGHDYHSRFEWNTVQNLESALAYVKQLVRTWAERGRDPHPSKEA